MSELANQNAALHAENASLRGKNAVLRCRLDHTKALIRAERPGLLDAERWLLVEESNRWSSDFGGCIE